VLVEVWNQLLETVSEHDADETSRRHTDTHLEDATNEPSRHSNQQAAAAAADAAVRLAPCSHQTALMMIALSLP